MSHNLEMEYDLELCSFKPLTINRLIGLVSNVSSISLSTLAKERLQKSNEEYEFAKNNGHAVYGETTGFGPFVKFGSGESPGSRHAKHLLAHLGAGCGDDAPAEVVRAAMILRIQALIQGNSGINPAIIEAYLKILTHGYVPSVPVTGSVGASGDLVPMASIAGLLVGYGSAWLDGVRIEGQEVAERLGFTNLLKNGRDALALVNCTSFSTAWTALAYYRGIDLLEKAEISTAVLMAQIGARQASLDPRLHEARKHEGQIQTAKHIYSILQNLQAKEDPSRELQEIYSIRCVPQTIGACRDQLKYVQHTIETEMNGVDDNPLVFSNPNTQSTDIIHGGNFFAQHVGFAADALNAALTQIGVLIERQLDLVVSPAQNKQWPLLLAWQEGAMSGLAGAQISASALIAEMRMQCQSYATSSIPTNGGNQDIVPMAANAGRQSWEQTQRLATLLATLCLSYSQLNALKEAKKIEGDAISIPQSLPSFSAVKEDRPLRREIKEAANSLLTI